ncbi:unnamed protein product, partial [Rotaria sp. Silwood1]
GSSILLSTINLSNVQASFDLLVELLSLCSSSSNNEEDLVVLVYD